MTSSRNRPVLILGDTPRVAVPVARSLRRCGIPVDVATLTSPGPRIASRAVRRQIRLPAWGGSQEDALIGLAAEHGYAMLLPITDRALCLACNVYDALSMRLRVGCPRPDVVRRVLDKDRTLAVADAVGIPVPRSYLVENADGLAAIRGRLRFPVLIKDRTKTRMAESTFKVRYFGDYASLESAFRRDERLAGRVVIQEYLPGEDIGLGVLMHQGEMLVAFQYRSVKDLPYTGGVTVLATSEPVDPGLRRGALDLLRALEWDGIAMVEYRRDPASGRSTLIEVNGRYWGSASLAFRAGVDLPLYEWQLAHGERPEIPPSYRVGLTWRWTAGYLLRLDGLLFNPRPEGLPRPSYLREVANLPTAFRPSVVSSLGAADDLAPAFLEFLSTVKKLIVAKLRRGITRAIPQGLRGRIRGARRSGPTTSRAPSTVDPLVVDG